MSKGGNIWNSIHTISSHNTHALMTIMVTGRLKILVIFSVMVQIPTKDVAMSLGMQSCSFIMKSYGS